MIEESKQGGKNERDHSECSYCVKNVNEVYLEVMELFKQQQEKIREQFERGMKEQENDFESRLRNVIKEIKKYQKNRKETISRIEEQLEKIIDLDRL